MALQFSITGIGTVMVQAAVNLLGATYIAAFSASGKICNIVTQAFPSIGITLATYVGQNMGAGEIRRIRQGVKITQIITIIVGVVCGLAVFFWGGAASRLFVADPTGEIRTICNEYFHATAWCYPFLGSIFIYRNTLQGMGDGLVPMIGGIFELLARGIMVTVLAGPLGFLGICLCDPGPGWQP
ncbi:MAG: MATE family efflux transporter [Blautia sp.]